MSDNTKLVYNWARDIKESAEEAFSFLTDNGEPDIFSASHEIGKIVGACMAIMEATKPIDEED